MRKYTQLSKKREQQRIFQSMKKTAILKSRKLEHLQEADKRIKNPKAVCSAYVELFAVGGVCGVSVTEYDTSHYAC